MYNVKVQCTMLKVILAMRNVANSEYTMYIYMYFVKF